MPSCARRTNDGSSAPTPEAGGGELGFLRRPAGNDPRGPDRLSGCAGHRGRSSQQINSEHGADKPHHQNGPEQWAGEVHQLTGDQMRHPDRQILVYRFPATGGSIREEAAQR